MEGLWIRHQLSMERSNTWNTDTISQGIYAYEVVGLDKTGRNMHSICFAYSGVLLVQCQLDKIRIRMKFPSESSDSDQGVYWRPSYLTHTWVFKILSNHWAMHIHLRGGGCLSQNARFNHWYNEEFQHSKYKIPPVQIYPSNLLIASIDCVRNMMCSHLPGYKPQASLSLLNSLVSRSLS